MGVITRSNHPKALWPGVKEWFGLSYNEHPLEVLDLFDQTSSDRAFEEFVQATGVGLASVKDEGGSITYDSFRQGYVTRVTHVVYGLGYIVTEEEIEDGKYKELSRARAGQVAFGLRQTKEIIGGNFYNRAFNSSYTFGDGKEMCATDHPNIVGGGTWSNELAVGAVLSEASLEDLTIQIGNATNDRGLKIALMPVSLHVPWSLYYKAHRLLMTEGRVGTANNDINVLRAMKVFPKGVKVNHYFTDTNNWFIRTNAPQSPLKMLTRRGVRFQQDNDFGTGNALAKADERYSFTMTDPRGIYGSAPA